MIAAEGIARDITEQVQAEAEIVERELLSRSVLESIQGPATVVDAEGSIRAVNADWTQGMLHHRDAPTAGALDTNYLELCDEEASRGVAGAAQAAAGLRAVLSGAEESFSFDYPVYGTDEEHWFVMQVSPLRTETGGAVVHHVDITDRKLYEQQLARHTLRDSLTGLANRALLSDRLDGALARSGPRGPRASDCCCSTSTGSTSSTTGSATRRATTCSWPSPPGSASSSLRAPPSPASAATSSSCSAKGSPATRAPARSPTASSTRSVHRSATSPANR